MEDGESGRADASTCVLLRVSDDKASDTCERRGASEARFLRGPVIDVVSPRIPFGGEAEAGMDGREILDGAYTGCIRL
jgi:hypothetical protein